MWEESGIPVCPPTDCQGSFSRLDQWVAVSLLQTVATSQEGAAGRPGASPLPLRPQQFGFSHVSA